MTYYVFSSYKVYSLFSMNDEIHFGPGSWSFVSGGCTAGNIVRTERHMSVGITEHFETNKIRMCTNNFMSLQVASVLVIMRVCLFTDGIL